MRAERDSSPGANRGAGDGHVGGGTSTPTVAPAAPSATYEQLRLRYAERVRAARAADATAAELDEIYVSASWVRRRDREVQRLRRLLNRADDDRDVETREAAS